MKTSRVCLPILVAGFVAGCSNPADSVSAAKVSAKTTTEPGAQPTVAGSTKRFVFGPDNSKIEFIGSKVTGSHNGGFQKFEGELLVAADGKLAQAGNKVTIDSTSLWTDNDRLTGHLKSPDFFNVEGYPNSTFVSSSVSQDGTNSTVTGNLTLHGITKQISFPASIEVTDQAVNVKADFSINRFDFEMKYPGKADDLIRKEVVLKLDVKAAPAPKEVASR
jgi:polyisoprenoid-binding protein YceI